MCFTVLIALAACPCLADEPAELLKKLAERRVQVKSLHQITIEKTKATEGSATVMVELWEKRDGKTLKQHVVRESAKGKAGDKTLGKAARSVTLTDGKTAWREVPIGESKLVVKSKPSPTDEFSEIKQRLSDGRARSKSGGKVKDLECVLFEIVGSGKADSFKASYWVSEKYGIILKRTYNAADGTHSELITTELKINEPVDDAKFAYTPPAGASVIDTEAMTKPTGGKKD